MGIAPRIAATLALVLIGAVACRGDGEPDRVAEPFAFTRWYVTEAINLYERDGLDAVAQRYTFEEPYDGDHWLFLMDLETGETLAAPDGIQYGVGHVTPPDAVDPAGIPAGRLMFTATERGRWIVLWARHPHTGELTTKHVWMIRHDGLLFYSGWYENDAPPLVR